MSPQPPTARDDDAREERARAEIWGLLAQLFHDPPDAALHARLQAAPTAAPQPGAFLETAFGALVDAARRLSPAAVRDEHEALFLGVGRPEVFLHGSYYLAGALNERPLAALRAALAELGLGRIDANAETEDHIAFGCEVMRCLIAGDAPQPLAVQRRFFDTHLRPWVAPMCAALAAHPRADFYRALAGFTGDFLAVEGQAFDLPDD